MQRFITFYFKYDPRSKSRCGNKTPINQLINIKYVCLATDYIDCHNTVHDLNPVFNIQHINFDKYKFKLKKINN